MNILGCLLLKVQKGHWVILIFKTAYTAEYTVICRSELSCFPYAMYINLHVVCGVMF